MFKYRSKTETRKPRACLHPIFPVSYLFFLIRREKSHYGKRFTSSFLNKNTLAIQMLLPDVLWYHISPSLKRPMKKNVNMLLKTTLYISVLPLTSFTSTSTVSQQAGSARRLKTTSKPLTLSKHDVLAGGPEIASWLWISLHTCLCEHTCVFGNLSAFFFPSNSKNG